MKPMTIPNQNAPDNNMSCPPKPPSLQSDDRSNQRMSRLPAFVNVQEYGVNTFLCRRHADGGATRVLQTVRCKHGRKMRKGQCVGAKSFESRPDDVSSIQFSLHLNQYICSRTNCRSRAAPGSAFVVRRVARAPRLARKHRYHALRITTST
jgi:hypothetical protein